MGSVHSNLPFMKTTSLRISAVQMIFSDSIRSNMGFIQSAVKEAKSRKADAVLFPECATTGYAYDFSSLTAQETEEILRTCSDMAKDSGINLLVGSAVHIDSKLHNAILVFDRKGKLVHCYAKCQLTDLDKRHFRPGNQVSLFKIDGVPCTTIICHERRYPELVRLAVMAGAKILFHPNAGMDDINVSKNKRDGRDGISVRAFENAIYYVFANSVGPQPGGKWSAGDSKIVGPDMQTLQLADNHNTAIITADVDLALATRKYALDSLKHPTFLAPHWTKILEEIQTQSRILVKPDGID